MQAVRDAVARAEARKNLRTATEERDKGVLRRRRCRARDIARGIQRKAGAFTRPGILNGVRAIGGPQRLAGRAKCQHEEREAGKRGL